MFSHTILEAALLFIIYFDKENLELSVGMLYIFFNYANFFKSAQLIHPFLLLMSASFTPVYAIYFAIDLQLSKENSVTKT